MFCLILALVMLLTLFPPAALAVTGDDMPMPQPSRAGVPARDTEDAPDRSALVESIAAAVEAAALVVGEVEAFGGGYQPIQPFFTNLLPCGAGR